MLFIHKIHPCHYHCCFAMLNYKNQKPLEQLKPSIHSLIQSSELQDIIMGWKTLKQHFNIQHYLYMEQDGLAIDLGLIKGAAIINTSTGQIQQSKVAPNFLQKHYPQMLEATPTQILELLNAVDTFDQNVTIYTYKGAEIIETCCEIPEWPNLTHDGFVIYENTHSTNKAEVIRWAKRNAKCALENIIDRIQETELKLAQQIGERHRFLTIQQQLEDNFPSSP